MMVVYAGLAAAIAVCAIMSIRASRLLNAILWLAGTSVLTAILLYSLGAREVAVIELSVGAGLVTVLLVVAISIAGEDTSRARSLLSPRLALSLVAGCVLLLALLIVPYSPADETSTGAGFAVTLWQERSADVLLQIVLVFTGLLTVLGLLAEAREPEQVAQAETAAIAMIPEEEAEYQEMELEEELPV